MGARIGIFGGTFDPPHVAHLVAAVDVRFALELDRVLLVVAHDPWQKTSDAPVTPAELRLEMTRLAIGEIPGLEVSDLELRRGGPSYTVDTVREVQANDPEADLFVVLGRDAAAGLPTWERGAELRDLASIVVVNRPSEAHDPLSDGWDLIRVTIPELAISSSELRRRVAGGAPVDGLTPPAVASYLARHGLYREELGAEAAP